MDVFKLLPINPSFLLFFFVTHVYKFLVFLTVKVGEVSSVLL